MAPVRENEVFVYHLPPLDFWDLYMSVEEYLRMVDEDVGSGAEIPRTSNARVQVEEFRRRAEVLAKEVGWEGDFRVKPHIFPIPDGECSSRFGLVWKQDNNGSTFVASPVEMPHLKDHPWVRRWKETQTEFGGS